MATDGDGIIIFYNGVAQNLLGFSPHAVLEKPCYRALQLWDQEGVSIYNGECPLVSGTRDRSLIEPLTLLVMTKARCLIWVNVSTLLIPEVADHCSPVRVHLLRRITPSIVFHKSLNWIPRAESPLRDQRKGVPMTIGDGHPQSTSGRLHLLTSRETEILNLLSRGLAPKEIAALLGISPLTVRTHVQRIYDKLKVHSRVEATLIALKDNRKPGKLG